MLNLPSRPDALAPHPWRWSVSGPFDAYSRDALHAATLAFLPYGITLYLSFALLDVYYVPAEFLPLVLAVRGTVTVLLAGCLVWLRRSGPGPRTGLVAALPPTLAGLSVAWMSSLWDRGANDYGSGIVLCVIAFGFLTRMPWHAMTGTLLVLVAYLGAHVLPGPLAETAVIPFVSHLSFVVGAGVLAGLQSYTAYVLRHATFLAQRESALLNTSLEAQVAARTAQLSAANEAFLRFVPAEFLRELGYEDITRARLGDARARRLTILFSDIRNFTTLSERLPPDQVFGLLNRCLSQLGPPVRLHGGFVDKYVGDAILALFPRSPVDAVRAAVDMQRALEEGGGDGLSVGVGIHCGDVMMGTIGEEQRFEATVIADAVNLAARVEGLTRTFGCGILVTRAVFEELDPETRAEARPVGRFAMKGKTDPTDLYDVFAADPVEVRAHKSRTRDAFSAAVGAYMRGDALSARAGFHRIVQGYGGDMPARWWLARCEEALAREEALLPQPHFALHEK